MIAVARRNSPTTISFWRFDGSSVTLVGAPNDLASPPFSVQYLVPGNFDGDQWPDFVASRDGVGSVLIYTFDEPSGKYVSTAVDSIPRPSGAPGGFGEAIAVGDLDGATDGLDEVVVGGDGALYIYKLNGATWSDPPVGEHLGSVGGSVALGNVDGVAGLDLIVGDHKVGTGRNRRSGQVEVFHDTGSPPFFNWTTPVTIPGNGKDDRFGSIVAAAETASGHDLVAIGSRDPKRAAVYETGALTVNPSAFTLTPDSDSGAGDSWAPRVVPTGDVDGNSVGDVLVAATAAPCPGQNGTGGRAYLFLNYAESGAGRIPFNAPNADEITWDTNQFGWGSAIVDDYIFISAPGDQRPGDQDLTLSWLFRAGRVFIYQYVSGP